MSPTCLPNVVRYALTSCVSWISATSDESIVRNKCGTSRFDSLAEIPAQMDSMTSLANQQT